MLYEKQVLEANDHFYKAFNGRDIGLMKEVWQHDESVICIHPGWKLLKGYAPIIESWAAIFENSENMDIQLSQVEVVASEDLAWVSCGEHLFTITPTGVHNSRVHATNLFKRVDGSWRMMLHHASALPSRPMEEEISSN